MCDKIILSIKHVLFVPKINKISSGSYYFDKIEGVVIILIFEILNIKLWTIINWTVLSMKFDRQVRYLWQMLNFDCLASPSYVPLT